MVKEKKEYKEDILKLREDGKTYNEIKNILGCSKATISYHCKRWGLNDIGLNKEKLNNEIIKKVKDYYKSHTKKETAKNFNISETTVLKYADIKRVILTSEERKKRNYKHVKDRRQKLKEMSVEYKGGKCEICGYDKCLRSLDFHHREPNEKDFSIGSYKIMSWEKIKTELNKCDLLCSNCHGEIHEEIENQINKINK